MRGQSSQGESSWGSQAEEVAAQLQREAVALQATIEQLQQEAAEAQSSSQVWSLSVETGAFAFVFVRNGRRHFFSFLLASHPPSHSLC